MIIIQGAAMRGISMDAVVKHGAQDNNSVGRKELMNAILLQKQIKNSCNARVVKFWN
jgi:hypothetical protein